MGDRSNINFISDTTDNGDYIGLNLYSHWGGRKDQVRALQLIADKQVRTIEDPSYSIAGIIKGLTAGSRIPVDHGMKPFCHSSLDDAYTEQQDNDHDILAIDYVHETIVYVGDKFDKHYNRIGIDETTYPLTADGARDCLNDKYADCADDSTDAI